MLNQLRNTVHGGGLTQSHVLISENDLEHDLSVPIDEVKGVVAAVDRHTDSEPARWGLRQTADRLWIQPAPLVDALTREGFSVLDQIFARTPLQSLVELSDNAYTMAEEQHSESDEVDRGDWQPWKD